MNNFGMQLIELLIRLPIVLIALTVHECAHGYVAYKLGDPTARNFGRLSLNPIKHIDPIGFLCMIFFRFGWAKPVPVNARYFKKPRRDMALTAFAGPVSNLLLSFFGLLLYNIVYRVMGIGGISANSFVAILQNLLLVFLQSFYLMNLTLAIFNLIPIPPLDGSRLFFLFLPDKYYFGMMKYERYVSLALMLALFTGILDKPLMWIVNLILKGMQFLISWLPFL